MKFKELMDRYKKGLASEEEKVIVEEEIEKYEIIEEYLAESMNLDFMSLNPNGEQKGESINLRKTISSRLRKVVITSVSIVLIIITGLFFIVSPIIDNLYYNPSKVSMGKHLGNLYFDLTACIELNTPGYAIGLVNSESLGFGEYDVYFSRQNLFTKESKYITSKIKRDRRIGNYEDYFGENSYGFGFETIRYPSLYEPQQIKEKNERILNHIKQLNPVSYVSVYLTFQEDFTMEELYEMSMDYSDIEFAWVGVRTAPKNEEVLYLTGFRTNPYAGSITSDRPNEDKYPAFQSSDWFIRSAKLGSRQKSIWPEIYELHYTSLLKYMVDRKEAVNAIEQNPFKVEYYQSALDYVEEHGVKTFGILVYSNASNLIKLVENEPIKTIELDQVMASKRYIN